MGRRASSGVSGLRQVALALERLRLDQEREPLRYIRWMRPQAAFHRLQHRIKLFRAGNQTVGKTTAGAGEVIDRCLGRHPAGHDVPPPPVEWWVICSSHSQSLNIQEKFWKLLPKGAIRRECNYNPKTGFGFHQPIIQFLNGSVIRFKTSHQQALDLAGATIDGAMFDEPPSSERIFAEVVKRVFARGGVVLLTLTPINARVDWLKEMVDEGRIREVHVRCTVDNLVYDDDGSAFIKPDGTVCDQAYVEDVIATSLPHEVPVTAHGEWEMRAVGRVFERFRDDLLEGGHLVTAPPDVPLTLSVGIDHGRDVGKQTSVLLGVDESGGAPDVYVLGAIRSQEVTSSAMDARSIVDELLAPWGLVWTDLDYAYGDRALGARWEETRKSNWLIEDALRDMLGVKKGKALRPRIRSAKKGRGRGRDAPRTGVQFLHTAMIEGRFHVLESCDIVRTALLSWDGALNTPHKDPLDALRYGLDPWVLGARRRSGPVPELEVR